MKGKKTKGKVIPLDPSKRRRSQTYQEALKAASDGVFEMHKICFEHAGSLAMTGKWSEWSESLPIGAAVEINEGMLRETRDPVVIRFMDMIKWIELLRIVIEDALEKEKGKK